MNVLDCPCGLQARMPSYHACFELPPLPQVPNQEPPRAQQLFLPEFLIVPHLEHTEPMLVGVTIGVYMWTLLKRNKEKNAIANRRLYTNRLELTFAALHALGPSALCVPVASTSTLLKPSTARSATTDSARFLECTALWAHRHVSIRQGECWRAD